MTAPTTLDITPVANAIDANASAAQAAVTALTATVGALAVKVTADVASAAAEITTLQTSVATNTSVIQAIQAALTKIASEIGGGTPPATTPPVTTPSTTDTLTASFTVAVSGLALTVTDTSTSSAGTPAGSSFDFGDGESGSVSQGGSTTHDYAQAGTYTVVQTAKDSTGATATSTQAVTVAATAPVTTPPVTTPPVTTPPVTTPPVTTPPSSGGSTGPLAGGGTRSSSGSTASGVDLSVGLADYGLTPVKFSPLAKPTKGQTVQDPDMPGATITRITDAVADFNAVNVIPAYPTCQAWNCDESRLVLYVQGGSGGGQHVMYDGKTYAFIKSLNINPSDIEQFWWDRNDPAIMYWLDNRDASGTYVSHLVAFNVLTGVATVVHDFAPDKIANGWQAGGIVRAGYPFFIGAPNNDLWGLGVGGIPNIGGYEAGDVFGWQRSTGQITKFQGLAEAQARTNFPTPLPSGTGWFYNNTSAKAAANYTTDIYNRSGVKIGSVPFSSNEHIGSNQNAAGDDYLVGNQYDTPVQGNIIVANLTQKSIKTLVGSANGYGYPRTGALTASACYNNPGWCVSGICGSPYGSQGNSSAGSPQTNPVTLLDQEIVIGNVDTGIVRRVCRHRSAGYYTSAPKNDYWAQPNVTISPSGTRILVQSDWGNADPSKPVIDPNASSDTYVITLPSYKG